jgi:hypothetical protein
MLKTSAARDLDLVEDPVGSEVQPDSRNSVIDEYHNL